jgi:sulfotransferase
MYMSDKTIYFINGMPRSGSTLLCNILTQNPQFHATPTSGLSELISNVNIFWNKNPIMRASETWEREKTVIKNIIQAWHSDTNRPIIFNKSRG